MDPGCVPSVGNQTLPRDPLWPIPLLLTPAHPPTVVLFPLPCAGDRHGLNRVSPLVPPAPGSVPAGSQPQSRWDEGLRVVLSKAFIDARGWLPSQGFTAWGLDPFLPR